jgi:hypothetical protein
MFWKLRSQKHLCKDVFITASLVMLLFPAGEVRVEIGLRMQ